ncbi:hypothetical protein [Streptomyces tubercidicus]|uniref:hypothetical protein n=1 Tax=Streptomyces tubercidicus TaxID=47759 RepID=UPI0034672509
MRPTPVLHDTSRAEDAVLGGAAIEDAARSAGTSSARLTEAVECYQAAGRAALDARPAGWHQVNIRFADYPSAERAFRAYLMPALRTGPTGAWWFVRKYPLSRLRVCPGPEASTKDAIAHLTEALDGSEKMLDAKATSLLATTLMMRAADLEFGEQGDVWGQ